MTHVWDHMRRWTPAALATFLALSVLLPYGSLLADSESNLPPCCRRNGSHHCVMRFPGAPSSAGQGDAFRIAADPCPFQKALTPVGRVTLYPGLSATVQAVILSYPAVHQQMAVSGLVAKSRSHQKRGPPFLLNC